MPHQSEAMMIISDATGDACDAGASMPIARHLTRGGFLAHPTTYLGQFLGHCDVPAALPRGEHLLEN